MKKFLFIPVIFLLICSCEENPGINAIITEKNIQLNNIHSAVITKDNGYLIAGVSDEKTTFIKLDANFNTLWRQDNYEWGTNYSEGGWGGAFYSVTIIAVFQKDQGNYVAIGSTLEGGCVVWSTALIIELDQQGDEIKKIDIQGFSVYNAIQTSDNGYLLLSNKLVKLDNNLDILWEKDISDDEYMENKIININEGDFAVTGTYNSSEVFLKKLDGNGNELMVNEISYNKTPFNDLGYDIIQLDDMGFLIVGRTRNTYEPYDIDCYIIRTDASGDTIWTIEFGRNTNDWLNRIIYSSDDKFIIEGTDGFPGDDIQRSILLNMDINGQIIDSCYTKKFKLLLYNPEGYFLKVSEFYENNIRLTKIPFSNLFR
jgi:hypothetical protein